MARVSLLSSLVSIRSAVFAGCAEAEVSTEGKGRARGRSAGGRAIWLLGVAAVAAALVLGGSPAARAQTANFAGVLSTLGGGFSQPFGVAIDGSGNVYVADQYATVVYEMPAGCASASCVTPLGGGFGQPDGVAVDSSGNVYVADAENSKVDKMPAGCASSTCVTSLGGGFSNPTGVAVDKNGNVYVADEDNLQVEEMPSTCTSSSCVKPLGGEGYSVPTSVAVDGNGNVYIASSSTNYVFEMPPGCASSSCMTSLGGGSFDGPFGVAVDGSGNVYVAAFYGNGLYEMPPNCTSSSCVTTLDSITEPVSMALDGHGNLYSSNYGNHVVTEIQRAGVNFGAAAVATTAPTTLPFNFTIDSSGTLGSPLVLTQGAVGKDFIVGSGSTCSGAVTAGSTCTVNVTFTPTLPGQRLGAVQLMSSTGAVVATATLQGTGNGPLVTFPSSTAVNAVGNGFFQPGGMAVDGNGDVFVADVTSGAVKEIVAGSGVVSSGSLTQPVGSGFNFPEGVAVDGSGDVFVASRGNGQVYEIVAVNGTVSATSTVNVVGSGFSWPYAVAVDSSGNVFVADQGRGAVYQIVAVNGAVSSSSTVKAIGSGFTDPVGVTVDENGNVFVADNGAVKKIVAVGGVVSSTSAVNAVGSGFSYPQSLAVDGNGDVFIADVDASMVYELVAVNGVVSSGSAVKVVGSFSAPTGVAVDGRGNVFVSSGDYDSVAEMDFRDPPVLPAFAATAVGTTSASQSITIANSGNTALTITVPGAGSNPSLSSDFEMSAGTCPQLSSSSSAATLAVGASCTADIVFDPSVGQSGVVNGQMVFADTDLNANPSTTQTVSLSGTAQSLPTVTGVAPDFGPTAGGTTVTITGTNFTGATAVMFGPTPALNFTLISPTEIQATSPLGAEGIVDITVTTSAGTSGTSAADQFIYQGLPMVTVSPSSVLPGGTATLTATIVGGGQTPTGAVSFTVGSGAAVSASCIAAAGSETCTASYPAATLVVGNYSVTASFAGDTFDMASTGTGTLTVVPTGFAAVATNVGSTSAPQTATLVFNSAVTLDATPATAIQVVTQGATGLDFAYVSGGSCTAGASYTAGQSCTVDYTFTPASPGMRLGAVVLYNNAATPATVASTYLSGLGNGPLAEFPGNSPTTLAAGIDSPAAVAVDASGNVYWSSNIAAGHVYRRTPGGNVTTYAVNASSPTFYGPIATAVDGAGNLYYLGSGSNGIQPIEVVAPGSTMTTRTISYTSTGQIQGWSMAVDAAGNIYAPGPQGVTVLTAANNYAQTTLASSLSISALTLDASGNIYAVTTTTDPNSPNSLFEIKLTGAYTRLSSTGISTANGIAVDAADNIYVSNVGNSTVVRFAAGSYAQTTVMSGFTPGNLAFDGSGNLYIANQSSDQIVEVARGGGPQLTFAGTAIGASSVVQTATLENDGNAPLAISSLATSSTNFTLDTTTTNCSTANALPAGITCNVGARFTPQITGALTGTFNIADNTLNVAGAVQQTPLSGDGTQATPFISVSSPTISYGTATTLLTATVSFVSGIPPTGAVSFQHRWRHGHACGLPCGRKL